MNKEEIQKYVDNLNHLNRNSLIIHTCKKEGMFSLKSLDNSRSTELALYYEQGNSNLCIIRKRYTIQQVIPEEKKDQIRKELCQQFMNELMIYSFFSMTTIGKLKDCFGNHIDVYSFQDIIRYGILTDENEQIYRSRLGQERVPKKSRWLIRIEQAIKGTYGKRTFKASDSCSQG